MRQHYHSTQPSPSTVRLIIAYKNFAGPHISHIGLGVSAINTSQVLRRAGIWADVWPIKSAIDLAYQLRLAQKNAIANGELPISHVVISAPWIPTGDLQALLNSFPNIMFAVVSHSNVAFLHADPTGMQLLRDEMGLQLASHNFKLGANGTKFSAWALRAYGTVLTYLPNLYNLESTVGQPPRPAYKGGVLRIGSFGALRILKNHMTAAAAALEVARRLGVDAEFWLSGGRNEGGAGMLKTIQEMVAGVPSFTLRQMTWQSWPDFRRTVHSMNLLIQVSFTESFNMVTADGVAEGVPSVTSDAIEWVPGNWQASSDDALDIANKAISLLNDPQAPFEGRIALEDHNSTGTSAWMDFLVPTLNTI